jgi:hypothetical protein
MPRQNVQVNRGGIRMESRPAQLNIDTYQARASMGLGHMNIIDFAKDEAQRAWQLTREGTTRIVENGNALARGSSPVEVAVQNNRASFHIETVMEYIPKVGPEFSATDGFLDVDIGRNEVVIDWEHIQAERAIFHPGSVDIVVTQHAEVVIEYVGPQLYFPPSADPNYTPVVSMMV